MKIDELAKQIRHMLRDDKDCVIGITAIFEREGKSTLAVQLGRAIDNDFKLERNILFAPTVKGILNLVHGLPKYSVIDADEAIKVLYKLKRWERMSIFLNQLYAICGQENHATLLCMVRFRDFNEFFRNHKIRIWIHVVERGIAVIMYKDKSPFSKDPWHMDENDGIFRQAIMKKKVVEYTTEDVLKALSKSSNYVDVLYFDDMEEELRIEYKDLKKKYSYDDLDLESSESVDNVFLYETAKEVAINPIYHKIYHGHRIADVDVIQVRFKIGRSKSARIKKIVENDIWGAALSTTPTTTTSYKDKEKSEKNSD